MNLADIATDQMQAVNFRRYPRKSPLAEEIHAEVPAKLEEGRIKAEEEMFEKELAQREEQSLAELAASEEQARKSEGITSIGMGLTGAKMLKEWGGDMSGLALPAAAFGIGYGVYRYTDKPLAGAAAGLGTLGLGSLFKGAGSNVIDKVLGSIGSFLGFG